MSYIYLAIAFTLNAAANVMLKVKADQGLRLTGRGMDLIWDNILFIAGVALFGVNIIFYFLALKNIPISTAYPVMLVMSLLIVNSYAFFALKEQITPMQLIGYAFIIGGLVTVFYFSKSS